MYYQHFHLISIHLQIVRRVSRHDDLLSLEIVLRCRRNQSLKCTAPGSRQQAGGQAPKHRPAWGHQKIFPGRWRFNFHGVCPLRASWPSTSHTRLKSRHDVFQVKSVACPTPRYFHPDGSSFPPGSFVADEFWHFKNMHVLSARSFRPHFLDVLLLLAPPPPRCCATGFGD